MMLNKMIFEVDHLPGGASVTFNPKEMAQFGYKIKAKGNCYVIFRTVNGERTAYCRQDGSREQRDAINFDKVKEQAADMI